MGEFNTPDIFTDNEYKRIYAMLDLHTAVDLFVDFADACLIDDSDLVALMQLLGRIRRTL